MIPILWLRVASLEVCSHFKAGPGCSGPCPVQLWLSVGMDIPQPLWGPSSASDYPHCQQCFLMPSQNKPCFSCVLFPFYAFLWPSYKGLHPRGQLEWAVKRPCFPCHPAVTAHSHSVASHTASVMPQFLSAWKYEFFENIYGYTCWKYVPPLS